MTDPSNLTATEVPCPVSVLTYGKRKVRYALVEGVPYFASVDIFALCNLTPGAAFFSSWDAKHLRPALLVDDATGEALDGITVTGAETIADRAKYPANRYVAAWARNRTAELMASEDGTPKRPPLTLLADGALPEKPGVQSDDYVPWHDLMLAESAGRR